MNNTTLEYLKMVGVNLMTLLIFQVFWTFIFGALGVFDARY